ncbi:MAG: hypothetical protein AAGA10_31250 [Bacteroidota bacterium]
MDSFRVDKRFSIAEFETDKSISLKNLNNFDETPIGADFNYYNSWVNKVDIGFDMSKVTGILFLI